MSEIEEVSQDVFSVGWMSLFFWADSIHCTYSLGFSYGSHYDLLLQLLSHLKALRRTPHLRSSLL